MKYLIILLVAIICSACTSSPSQQSAQNVLLAFYDDGIILHEDKAAKQLSAQVNEELITKNVNTFELSHLILDDFEAKDLLANKARIINFARSQSNISFDYLVLLSADGNHTKKPYTIAVNSSAYVEVIDLQSGRILTSGTATGKRVNVHTSCSLYCINNAFAESLQNTGPELASLIMPEIASNQSKMSQQEERSYNRDYVNSEPDFANRADYKLVLDGFTPEQISRIQDYLLIFSGYQDMQVAAQGFRYAEINYWSEIASGKLKRNSLRMLKELNLFAKVKFAGDVLRIEQTNAPEQAKFDLDGWD